eukprot:6631275-Prymnesium_polylepis.2
MPGVGLSVRIVFFFFLNDEPLSCQPTIHNLTQGVSQFAKSESSCSRCSSTLCVCHPSSADEGHGVKWREELS